MDKKVWEWKRTAGPHEFVISTARDLLPHAFVQEAFKHCKTIAANGAGLEFIRACRLANGAADGKAMDSPVEEGVILSRDDQAGKIASEFIKAIAQHRHWSREKKLHSPA